MLSKANDNRVAPSAVNLSMENIEDILGYIEQNYNLVDVKIPKEETALIPIGDVEFENI